MLLSNSHHSLTLSPPLLTSIFTVVGFTDHRRKWKTQFILPLSLCDPFSCPDSSSWFLFIHILFVVNFRTLLLHPVFWTFPCFNLLKLNTDGSSKGNPGPSSFGGLIRDCNGRWLRGYMGKMSGRHYTALEAEVWSIFNGLCLIKEMDLSFMLIETDCMAAVRLTMKELDNDNPLKRVMDAIKELMLEQRCTMIHTKRDGNHCADQLAKLGGKQSEEYMVLDEPPELLIPYLLRDIDAASYQFQRNPNH